MDTNRKLLGACIASLALISTAAPAQTIYKQVDEEGRVIFTDQPAPGARTITSYETGRPRTSDPSARTEWPSRASDSETSGRNAVDAAPRPNADTQAQRAIAPAPRASSESSRRIADWAPANLQSQQAQVTASPPSAGPVGPRSTYAEVERAVATYKPLDTPMAAQADAVEASRRARLEANKASGGAILVVQAAPRDHEPAVKKSEGMDTFYLIWALTFFALAGGLLYVGWQVLRLILGTAFPRWRVGVA